MQNIFNKDFQDFIGALTDFNVEYILVGGYSVILHGYARTTGDMDIWVNKTIENYKRLQKAFQSFGMPLFDMTLYNFLDNPELNVFSFGRPPVSIDIMTEVKGLDFENTFQQAKFIEIENLSIRLIQFNDLIKAKRASGRPKDLDDLENLVGKK